MVWRYLPLEIDNAARQVSIDHALYKAMHDDILQGKDVKPIVRFYKFFPEAVVLGHEQSAVEFNRELCDKEGCMYTTRLSGGGSVYFTPNDLHISFVYPTSMSSTNLRQAFKTNTERVAEAIQKLAPNAEIKIGHTGTSIRLNGKLVYGSAMARGLGGSCLYHGTVYLNNDWEKASRYLNLDLPKLKEQFGNLTELSAVKDAEKLANEIQNNILSQLQFEEDKLSTKEKMLADELYNFYSDKEKIVAGKRKAGSCFLPPIEADEIYFVETLKD